MSVPASQMSGGAGLSNPASSLTSSTSGLDYIDPATLYNGSNNFGSTTDTSGGANTSGSSIGSDLSAIGSGVGSFLNSPLGDLALFGGAGYLAANQASGAAAENAQLAGGISAIGAPAVGESNQLLGAYSTGALTTPFQQQLTAALTANQQGATSQQQSVAQGLANSGGGQNIQSAQFGQNQQIAAQKSQLDTQATAQAFAGELSASEGLLSAGGQYVQSGILAEIQSNVQLQAQLAQLFGGLGSAYAQSQGGAGATGGSGIGSMVQAGKGIGNLINSFTGAGSTAAETASLQGTVDQLGAGIGSDALSGAASDFNTASTFTDAAGGASDLTDLGSFSAGSAAAGAAGAGASAADLGTVGLTGGLTEDPAAAAAVNVAGGGASALGYALPVAGAAIGGYETYQGIESGNALSAGLSGAETGAAIGSFIGPEGTIIGGVLGGLVGAGGALAKGQHTMENIKAVGPNQGVIKLQSGNSALQQGGVAFGAGSSRGQGGAQWFLVPQDSQQLGKGPSVTKGTPFYIGTQASQDLTNFANSVPLKNGQPDFSSYIAQYNQNPNANTGLVGVYQNNGGQATWGQSFPDWLQSIYGVKHNVGGNLST